MGSQHMMCALYGITTYNVRTVWDHNMQCVHCMGSQHIMCALYGIPTYNVHTVWDPNI
jgi:hypothetical protein